VKTSNKSDKRNGVVLPIDVYLNVFSVRHLFHIFNYFLTPYSQNDSGQDRVGQGVAA